MNFLRIFSRSFTKSLWKLKKFPHPLRCCEKAAHLPLDKSPPFVLLYYCNNTKKGAFILRTTRFHRAGALALAAALFTGTAVQAAEPTPSTTARQQDLDVLYQSLERYHPDLFANTPEADFLARKAEIESRLATESEVDFVLDLQSLTALAGDSHTQASLNAVADQVRFYPAVLTWYDGRWYLTTAEERRADLLGREVTAVNGHSMEEVLDAFSALLSADNPVKLRRQYRQSCNVADLYEYVGLVPEGGALELTLENSRTLAVEPVEATALGGVSLARLSDQITAQPATAAADAFYWSTALDGDTYYIQYNTCREDPELPMETFAAQVRTALDGGDYSRVLVDLRNNGGGSDGVIWPLLAVLRQEMDGGAEVVGLIGETTFSSAIINAVELQEMGAVLVGEPTSGSVDHFGSVGSFALPNSGLQIGVSTKYIDLGTLLDADAGRGVESLEPDVTVPQTMADTLAGRDSAVEWLLAHPERLEQRAYPDAPLTRGRFVGLLHEAAGAPAARERAAFDDLLGIEWYLPAVSWAGEAAVTNGASDGTFAAARPLTWQEAAVFLVRAAGALELEPEMVRAAPLPAALAEGAWDRAALELAWGWGLLPEDAGASAGITRAQGAAMAEALRALL